jgi:hypothetical protein
MYSFPILDPKTLMILNLDFNDIGDNGVQHLADALRNNTVSYRTLSLFSLVSNFYAFCRIDTDHITSKEQ